MALYHGDYDSFESNIPLEGNESLLVSYRSVTSQFNFTGARAFRRCCLNRERDFVDGSLDYNEYILFTGVNVQDMMVVDKSCRSLPRMCCLYDASEEVLIVKLMIGAGHGIATDAFLLIFTDKLRDLGLRQELYSTGSGRFGDQRRQKEADGSFKPGRTRLALDDWPSITFEVGFSESLSLLRTDAHFWLTRSNLQTKIVLIIHIDRVHRTIVIERWEVINAQRPHCLNVQYLPSVGCIQRIDLREGGVYTGPPLALSIDKLFDAVPPNLVAGALDFTAGELQAWNDTFWERCP